jgi:hypothetical protein
VQHADAHHAVRQLHGVVAASEFFEPDLRTWSDTNDVTVVKLHFGARIRRGCDIIAHHQRCVDAGGFNVARVSTLHVDVAVQRADERYAGIVRLCAYSGLRPGDEREGEQRRREEQRPA